MPPSKKIKRQHKPELPTVQPEEHAPDAQPDVPDDGASATGTLETIPTDDEFPVDPALLDEEDAPGIDDLEEVLGGKKGKRGAFAGGYNSLKTFNGQVYSGMAVGGSHTWNYDQGVWKETKEEPDLWKIDYKATKRRTRKAPEKSGAPVGTQYHWFIVAHQYVEKTDANTYTTHLVGSKYKLAHKGANSDSWSVPKVKGQRDREVELLEDAKRRVQNLPPVLASEKVKVTKQIKGQQTLDGLFKSSPKKEVDRKRKAVDQDVDE